MELNFTKGSTPLYSQLRDKIKSKIDNGVYQPGETIPTESELQEKFGVSRTTVRKAIEELVKAGYLIKKRGKGTIVRPKKIEENLNKIMSFTNEMKQRGLEPSTKEVKMEKEKPNKKIADFMEIKESKEIYKLSRLRCADGEPLVIFVTYINPIIDLPLADEEYFGSLYETIKEKNGVKVTKAHETIDSTIANEEMASKLNIKKGSPIIKRIRKGYTAENIPLEFTKSFYRADRYNYSIVLKD